MMMIVLGLCYLNNMEKEELKEFIFQAIQAGKSETSGLVLDVTNKVTKAVKEQVEVTVKETVNGKIDDIKKHLIRQDNEMSDIRKELGEMREEVQALKPLSEGLSVARVVRKFLLFVAPFSAILLAFYKWLIN